MATRASSRSGVRCEVRLQDICRLVCANRLSIAGYLGKKEGGSQERKEKKGKEGKRELAIGVTS